MKSGYAHLAVCMFCIASALSYYEKESSVFLHCPLSVFTFMSHSAIVAMFFKRGASLFSLFFVLCVILQSVFASSSPGAYRFMFCSLTVVVRSCQVHLCRTIFWVLCVSLSNSCAWWLVLQQIASRPIVFLHTNSYSFAKLLELLLLFLYKIYRHVF